jgi:hypothetical protein
VTHETRFRVAISCVAASAICVVGYLWALTGAYTPDEVLDATRTRWFVENWQWLTAAAAFYLLGYCFLPKEDP